MTFTHGLTMIAAAGITLLVVPGPVRAISPLPDTTSPCSSTGPCFKITNSNTTSATAQALVGISGNGSSTGMASGVYGASASGRGVSGYSLTLIGVGGESQAGNGIQGNAHASGHGVAGINDFVSGGAGGFGVYGSSLKNDGIQGQTSSATHSGVSGIAAVTGGGGIGVFGSANGPGTGVYGSNANTAGFAGYFNGNVIATGTITPGSSDARLKKDVKSLEGALDKLLQLRGVTYQWKDPAEHGNQAGTQRGFIAQDVEKVLPEWIGTDAKGFKTISIPGRGLEALVVESVRTLKIQNDELRVRNDDLSTRVKALEGRHPVMSSIFSGGLGSGLAIGLLPLGFVVGLRRRKDRRN